jgi:hypothetical protein
MSFFKEKYNLFCFVGIVNIGYIQWFVICCINATANKIVKSILTYILRHLSFHLDFKTTIFVFYFYLLVVAIGLLKYLVILKYSSFVVLSKDCWVIFNV